MTDTAVIIGVGASRGLGAAVARRFARGGLQVVIAGRSLDRLAKVAGEINSGEGSALYCVTDATQAKDLDNLLAYAAGNGRVAPGRR